MPSAFFFSFISTFANLNADNCISCICCEKEWEVETHKERCRYLWDCSLFSSLGLSYGINDQTKNHIQCNWVCNCVPREMVGRYLHWVSTLDEWAIEYVSDRCLNFHWVIIIWKICFRYFYRRKYSFFLPVWHNANINNCNAIHSSLLYTPLSSPPMELHLRLDRKHLANITLCLVRCYFTRNPGSRLFASHVYCDLKCVYH